MIRELLDSGYAPGVHLYTLNREVAPTSILKKLGETSFVNETVFFLITQTIGLIYLFYQSSNTFITAGKSFFFFAIVCTLKGTDYRIIFLEIILMPISARCANFFILFSNILF